MCRWIMTHGNESWKKCLKISYVNHFDVTLLSVNHMIPCEVAAYSAFVFQQVKGRSVYSSSCMRCCKRLTCVAASGGSSRQMVHSSSPHRTKRSSPRCGASARATAKPWPTKRWRALCVTTRAPERSVKSSANSRISLTRERSGGFRTTCRNSAKSNCSRIKTESLWHGRAPE